MMESADSQLMSIMSPALVIVISRLEIEHKFVQHCPLFMSGYIAQVDFISSACSATLEPFLPICTPSFA
jgi:hypothetical protein